VGAEPLQSEERRRGLLDAARQIHPDVVRRILAVHQSPDGHPERLVRRGLQNLYGSDVWAVGRRRTVREHRVCAAGTRPAHRSAYDRRSAFRVECLRLEVSVPSCLQQPREALCTRDAVQSEASPRDEARGPAEQGVAPEPLSLVCLELRQPQRLALGQFPLQEESELRAPEALQLAQLTLQSPVSPEQQARERREQQA